MCRLSATFPKLAWAVLTAPAAMGTPQIGAPAPNPRPISAKVLITYLAK